MKTEEKNNRMEALAYIIADLKAENVELEQRVHQLMDEYNEAVRQLRGMEKRNDEDPAKQTLGEMMQMRDRCDKLAKDNEHLKQQYIQIQTEFNEAQRRVDKCEWQKEELVKCISRFDYSEFVEIGVACTYRPFAPNENPVKVGSDKCCKCRHIVKVDVFGKKYVLCACRYDNTEDKKAQERKNVND